MSTPGKFSRRERQILDILYRRSPATVSEVREAMQDAPSYSSVRALLAILEGKGHVSHQKHGSRYVYLPSTPRSEAARSALSQLVETFFGGSTESVVATLISESDKKLSDAELDRLARLIESAKSGDDTA